jgi:outer membrane receptor for ferrienterochelin and colicins
MINKLKILSIVSLLLVLMFSASAQIITGKVIDGNGFPLEMAKISSVLHPNSYTFTNHQGFFELADSNTNQLVISHFAFITDTISINIHQQETIVIQLKPKQIVLNDIVVSAARMPQLNTEIATPIAIISNEEIAGSNLFRLSEILETQTGLQIYSDHGTGVQMQGLNSDYVQILINGEPIIGRVGGVLDLDRISLNNIERIEIIKGPSSAMYGSEALAGIINIITKQPEFGWQLNLGSKIRTYLKTDSYIDGSFKNEKFVVRGFFNSNGSKGFDVDRNTIVHTVPKFQNYSGQLNVDYWITEQTKLQTQGSFFNEKSSNQDSLYIGNSLKYSELLQNTINGDAKLALTHYFKKNFTLEAVTRYSIYDNVSDVLVDNESYVDYKEDFKQHLWRTNLQANFKWKENLHLVSGVGLDVEKVVSSRYLSDEPFIRGFIFSQLDWNLISKLYVTTGFRIDIHSVYKEQFSPKLALKYAPVKWINLQASIGSGYKAPDFRQLILNFTNPTVGYSVFGSELLLQSLQELESSGQISTYIIHPDTLSPLRNEFSWAFNGGLEINPFEKLKIQANAFRNNIYNLIETLAVATKTNGQNVFSYFNLNKVITQGIETNVTYFPLKELKLSAGYQFLDTKDIEAVKAYKNGEVIANNERLTIKNYGGLYNRSRHTANIKIQYQSEKYDFNISTRLIYRGKFGYGGETNFTGFLDAPSEYANGYFQWDIAVQKQIKDFVTFYFSVDNITHSKNIYLPAMPGRQFMGGVSFHFLNNQFNNQKNNQNEKF